MKETEFLEVVDRRADERRRLDAQQAGYLAHKQESRARVSADVDAYLARGGTIQQMGNTLPHPGGNFRTGIRLRGSLEPHAKK